MNLLSIKIGVVLILIIFLGVSISLLPAHKESIKEPEETEKISSSFFVSGIDKNPIKYQSILSIDTNKDNTPTENILLSEFLKENILITNDIVNNPVSSSVLDKLKKYGNEIGNIYTTYIPDTLDETAILEKSITEPENISARTELLSLSKRYTDLSDELLNIGAPFSVSLLHKGFIDSHRIVGNTLKTLSQSARTLEDITEYNNSTTKYIEAYLNLAQYLKASGVRFDDSEPGSLFTLPF